MCFVYVGRRAIARQLHIGVERGYFLLDDSDIAHRVAEFAQFPEMSTFLGGLDRKPEEQNVVGWRRIVSSCALSFRRGIVYLMKSRIGRTLAWTVVAVGWIGVAWSPTPVAWGQSESEIVSAFREAHASHQLDRMLRLFCWDRVTPEMRQMTENELSQSLDEELSVVRVTGEHPAGRSNRYIRNGMVYGHNLTVEKELVVESLAAKGDPQKTYFPLGIKDGRYQIALMVPLGSAAMQPEVAALLHSSSSFFL
jgi:hypothetical protein